MARFRIGGGSVVKIVCLFRKRFNDTVSGTGHRSGGRSRPKVLTQKLEGELADRVKTVADAGFPSTAAKVRQVAYTYAKENDKDGFSDKTKKAGRKWFKGFMKRHPELGVKKATLISKPRAQCATKEAVAKWLEEYAEKVIRKYGITNPRNIWNVDETNVRNIPRERKYVGRVGKRLQKIYGCERAETSTVIIAVNAAGEYMPPMVLHRGAKAAPCWSNNKPKWWCVRSSPSGYICDEIFLQWGNMFIGTLQRMRIEGNVALTMDGHGSHVYNLPFVDQMFVNAIHVALLPPHCTHVLQVLDQYPLESLKTHLNDNVEEWCDDHAGDPLPKSEFFAVFVPAFEKAMTRHNIQAAFRVTGIFPIDASAIPEDKYIVDIDSK